MAHTTKVISSPTALEELIKGVNILADAVSSTLGPMGSTVVIETPYGATTVTKDGVTVASQINLEDPVQNLGAQIIKQAASRTAHLAGDGTTTATLLAQSLVTEARKLIVSGVPPIEIKRDLEAYLKQAVQLIRENSNSVSSSQIYNIATISANNDPAIGSLIQQAYDYVGPTGVISIEDSKTSTTDVALIDGTSYPCPYVSHYFITDSKTETAVLENPLIYLTDAKLSSQRDIFEVLEHAAITSRPLLIIADSVDSEALQLAIINKLKSTIKVCICKPPSFGAARRDILEDIAALTSATLHSTDAPTPFSSDLLGSASKVTVTRDSLVLIDPTKDEESIQQRADKILASLTSEDTYNQNRLKERLAKLTAKVAVIYAGAPTETEAKEIKFRIDDALKATSAAIAKGYLVGGGTALARISTLITPASSPLTLQVFKKALTSPLRKISENAGISGEVSLSAVLSSNSFNYGYNALTSELEDLIEAGVIDPTLVVEQALINAVSAASMIIMSSTAVHSSTPSTPYTPPSMDQFVPTE